MRHAKRRGDGLALEDERDNGPPDDELHDTFHATSLQDRWRPGRVSAQNPPGYRFVSSHRSCTTGAGAPPPRLARCFSDFRSAYSVS